MMRGREAAALVAEAIGTFLFFFVGAGSIVLGDYLAGNGGTGPCRGRSTTTRRGASSL